MSHTCLATTVAALLLGLIPICLQAQDLTADGARTGPVGSAARTEVAPVIDGRLDESVWANATVITDFVQHEPLEGQAATERTEIRVLFDGDAVYVGARLLDRQPSGILLGENRRDANLRDADALLLVFDTFRDRQNAYVFGTTPVGIEYDGQVTKDGQGGLSTSRRVQTGPGAGGGFNLNWDGSWEVATSIDDEGWHAEFRIPFSTLQYGAGGEQVWGMNVARMIRRTNEEVFWAPIARQFTVFRVSEAGELLGIQAPTRRWVTVTPYVRSSAERNFAAQTETDLSATAGGDAKVGLTPGLTLDLTVNTDFAQVEVDEQQLNLTRFSLFFPEKRPFFLENAGIFTVGTPRAGSDLGLDLFYSRRIGLSDDGREIPILAGGRVTGKIGGVTVGAMSIQTDRVDDLGVAMNNYSVARVLQELPNRSRIGGMFISRLNTDSSGDYNLTYDVDGRLGIGESFNLDGYASLTTTPGLTGRNHGIGFTASFLTRDWDLGAQYRDIGEDFNPEVGFLPRDGYRAIIGRVQRMIRLPSISWLRQLNPHMMLRNFYDFDWFHESRYLHIDFSGELENGGFFSLATNVRREGLIDPFEIADGVIIPPDTYDFTEFRLRFGTNQSAAWAVTGDVTVGGFYSGSRESYVGELTNRIGSTWVGALRLAHDDVDLAEGAFKNTLVGAKLAYSFTPRVFLQALVQYNTDASDVSANIRFGWLNTAGTGLFLVYNEVQHTEWPTGPVERAFIIKYTHQFNVVR